MHNRPRVSAIIAAYNSAPFLRDAIESVLGQTRPVDEIVLMDDGSTDATPAIASEYPQIRYITQANQGPSAARNRAVAETTGDLIAFLDGDDAWLPDKTERQLACFARDPDVALVSGDKIWWDVATGKRHRSGPSERQRSRVKHEIFFHNYVGNCSLTMVRRDIFNQVGGFDTNQQWGEDWELWIRIIERAKAAFVPEPVALYRCHPDNQTNTGKHAKALAFNDISMRAIRRAYPSWRRPAAYVRRFSLTELDRAGVAANDAQSWQHLRHAAAAFFAYPLEKFPDKFKHLGRALIGEARYRAVKSRWSLRGTHRTADEIDDDRAPLSSG